MIGTAKAEGYQVAKRHHYVPVTYLRQFTDAEGRLHVYRKDEPTRVLRVRPEEAGFERYYYSQVADDGTRDDEQLEALFSDVERHWPSIVGALGERLPNFPTAPHIIPFLALMRVRGPAFRDAMELQLAHTVHATAKVLQAAGKLPPMPKGHEDLLDKVDVAIDPHRSLIAMGEVMGGIGQLFASLNYEAVHNETDIPFITSDNPVIYFDPRIPDSRMLPYKVDRLLPSMELLFPVTPRMLFRGSSALSNRNIGHRSLTHNQWVKRVNRLSARFGYRAVFTNAAGFEALVTRHATTSPIVRFDRIPIADGRILALSQFVFGPRPNKPKWQLNRRA